MKVGQFLDISKLVDVLVKLPDEALYAYPTCCGGSREMYIIGPMGGDFFLSPDAPTVKKRIKYPMPKSINPIDILDWDIVNF